MADKKAKPSKKKLYKMPKKLTNGEVLTDIKKVSWVIGGSIGVGGFGEIYVAAKSTEPSKLSYAVKIEPLENGPLFCERTVYINIGKQEDIDEFKQLRGLKSLGIPVFYGFGRHLFENVDYRFIVIEKLGKDLTSCFGQDKRLPYPTILKIGIQILHVLEYMHGKLYVHCDVKAGNLLLGETKGKQNQVYVVDFGLACKYATVFKPDPKKAHDGTPLYTSRDAHAGVMTRRGDLEILFYNLLHWASGRLPWEHEADSVNIQLEKEGFMENPGMLLAECYKTEKPHMAVKKFLSKVIKMEALEEPDFPGFVEILESDLKKLNSNASILEFGDTKSPTKKIQKKPEEKGVDEVLKLPIQRKIRKKPEEDDEVLKSPIQRKIRKKPEEDGVDEVPKSPIQRKIRKKPGEKVIDEVPKPSIQKKIRKKSEVQSDDEERDSPVRRTRNKPLGKANAEELKSPVKKPRMAPQEKGDGEDEPAKPKRRRRVLSETATNEIDDVPIVRKSPRQNKATDEKKSWRDCPTMVHGAVVPRAKTPQKRGRKN